MFRDKGSANGEGQRIARKARTGRLPLVIAAVVLVLLGLNYYFYVRSKTQYYTTRDLRMLKVLGEQIDESVKAQRGFVRNFAMFRAQGPDGKAHPYQTLDFVRAKLETPQDREWAERSFPGFAWMSRQCSDSPLGAQPPEKHTQVFSERMVEVNGEPWLRIDYRGWRGTEPVVSCGEVSLKQVMQTGFRPALVEAFDTVLLVDGTGAVLHRATPEHQTSARGFGAARPAHDAAYRREVYGETIDLRVNTLTALNERTGWNSHKPFDVNTLGVTRNAEVRIADTGYLLFAQPSPISVRSSATTQAPPKDPKARAGDPNQWTLCALISKRRFMYEALAVSETMLALVTGVLLLIIAAWPFMRLSLINEFKPVRIADVIFLAVSTTVVAAIFTIGIGDAIIYRRLHSMSDVHLKQFAVWLDGFFNVEIGRALNALDYIETNGPLDETTDSNRGYFERESYARRDPTKAMTGVHPLETYPYFSTFSWIDGNGWQAHKRSVGQPIPQVDVSRRDYFQRVLQRRMWLTRRPEENTSRPFALEALRSMTTGVPEVVISKPTSNKKYPVLALTLTAAQLIDPVLPAAFTFAVIDERGRVLFHSDKDRNGMENFFEETDQNRQFRSAIFARHEGHVDLRYGGQDYRAFLTPMKHLPWTIIVLRHKQLLRTMNAETIVITLMCLVFLISGAVLVMFVIAIARPRYRAPWLWPSYDRGRDYVRLCFTLCLLALAGIMCAVMFESGGLLVGAFILPPIALVTTFACLHRRAGWIFVGTVLIWVALSAVWIHALLESPQTKQLPMQFDGTGVQIVGALLLMTVLLTFLRTPGGSPALARRAYMTMAVLLLIVTAIVPTIGFLKTAYRLEIQNLVKYSQLTVADRLHERIELMMQAGYADTSYFARHFEIPAAFSTRWWVLGPTERPPVAFNCAPPKDETLLPDFVEQFLPQYSEDSVAMREMHHDASTQKEWWWCRDGALLALHKTIRFSPVAIAKLWPEKTLAFRGGLPLGGDRSIHPLGSLDPAVAKTDRAAALTRRADVAVAKLVVSSEVPSMLPRVMRRESILAYPSPPLTAFRADVLDPFIPRRDPALSRGLRAGSYLVAIGVAMAILWWALNFIARIVFLADVREPIWLTAKLRPRVGDHLFLFRKKSRDLGDLAGIGFYRVQLRRMGSEIDYRRVAAEIEQLPPGSSVLIEDFEWGVTGDACALKLRMLEHLLRLPQCWIVIVSIMSPPAIVAMAQEAGAPPDAWHAVMKRFVWIADDQLKPLLPQSAAHSGLPAQVLLSLEDRLGLVVERVRSYIASFKREESGLWLKRESGNDPLLMQIARELESHEFMTQTQVIDEFGERAASYYDMLWASCADDEKLILCQLAKEGLVNGKNRRSVRRLIGRGLIRRKPQLSLLNESFRAYVLTRGVAEAVDIKHVDDHDTWSAISRPLAFVLVAVVVMFLVTQKDLANTASAVVTALAGGIPALIKLIGVLTDRKQAAA